MYLPDYIAYDDTLEFLGPREGWNQEKEYTSAWVRVDGTDRSNADGSSRAAVAERCNVNSPVYLFWEKDAPYDLSAVAVYHLDARHDRFYGADQLGCLPAAVGQDCVRDYLLANKRLGAVIRRIFRSDIGYAELYLELFLFRNPNSGQSGGRTRHATCEQWRKTNVKRFLSTCSELDASHIEALERAGLLDCDKLCATSTPELLKIDGLSEEAAAIIRRYYPLGGERLMQ
jgi:hypothetical protein